MFQFHEEAPSKNASGRIILISAVLCFSYAILRYHIAGDVPWNDLPFFIFNKGIALTAFVLLTFNFTLGPLNNLGIKVGERWLQARKALGMTGFLLVLIHALISFMIFKPTIFGKFFVEDGSLTLNAGISMLAGILGFVVLWGLNLSFQTQLREDKSFIKFITSRKFMLGALLLGGIHVFFMGIEGWKNPADWNGGLPPISLIAFVFAVAGYGINFVGRK
jgi:DMSO/TMAO reductase YedYZ heme-binding membrane subunit